MAIAHSSDATFEQDVLAKTDKPVLVDFWAEWCGPCRMLAPVLEALDSKYADKLQITKIDTDANPQVAQNHQITGIPCCILFKDGKEVTRFVGFRNESAFDAELKEHLSL